MRCLCSVKKSIDLLIRWNITKTIPLILAARGSDEAVCSHLHKTSSCFRRSIIKQPMRSPPLQSLCLCHLLCHSNAEQTAPNLPGYGWVINRHCSPPPLLPRLLTSCTYECTSAANPVYCCLV